MRKASMSSAVLIVLALALAPVPAPADGKPVEVGALRIALGAACAGLPEGHSELLGGFPGAKLLEARVTAFRGQPGLAIHAVLLESGAELRLSKIFPLGRLRRVNAEYHGVISGQQVRPELAVTADGQCQVREARRIIYDDAGKPASLRIFGPDLRKIIAEEPLNPAVPPSADPGADPGGAVVAVVDTGVNYLLDVIARRLARDGAGKILGVDYWDQDARPFDVDTGRSAFFPLHHGTAVASIVLREAPAARIIPYRFPRPEMSRMGELVADADQKGAIIINMAMGSSKHGDWEAFEAAARARPHMLFIISAGNDGRDIDKRPVYPAALDLGNILTVTSADAFGRLARGSNWGRKAVDIMAPGEKVAVVDHRGVAGQASGSSFAVPRIAALAARLLAKNPTWRGPDLKRAILSRAKPSLRHPDLPLKHGWIPDPMDDFLPGR
ncbi:MAG: S8 family serine peptidase [Rhodospirillaceae bacterium]|nr:S8 family serine peptidase [Rhodospirillaceae bacterium]